jgi:DNA (cytosine-5)-methyltransferase 1
MGQPRKEPTMTRPKLLDLFCCQGGASAGYVAAGFEVVGVDLNPQPRYPYRFFQRDALNFLDIHGKRFDAIHASPPCQAFTNCQRIQGNEHPDLIEPTRKLLERLDVPWVIENVEGAPLNDPTLLCGEMFGLRTYRHRLFESNVPLAPPTHPPHLKRTTKMGRPVRDGENMHVVGNFTGVDLARDVMGMPWASRDGLREAIPPAYAEFIGRQLIAQLGEVAA